MTSTQPSPKRLILGALTILVVIHVSFLLFGSLGEPQITSRLELYQTDLLLNATEAQLEANSSLDSADTRKALLGDDPLGTALSQYQSVRRSAQTNLSTLRDRLTTLTNSSLDATAATAAQQQQLQDAIQQQQQLINQLDLRIGILQAQNQDIAAATQTWAALEQHAQELVSEEPGLQTINTLAGLWSDPPRILPDAEQQLQKLDGWFRYTALRRLYELQQRSDALIPLQATAQEVAQQTLIKLILIGSVPLIGSLIGVGLLIFLITQRVLRGKQALLEKNADLGWETPWEWETILQVLIVGFFFLGQFFVPYLLRFGQSGILVLLGGEGINLSSGRAKAIFSMTYYLMMSAAGLLVLYLSVKRFFPLPDGWFRLRGQGKWLLWGIGGYFAALPLMVLIALVNQQIWNGQGGSNPLLQIVLEEADPIALGIFFFTAAIAAPAFEETLFRGFLLPSLTRYVSVWGAIVLSSILFAIAHLSLSEVIPLTVLGSVLGVVYTRSRSLLASMFLHSLWNSATMIGLLILGSGS